MKFTFETNKKIQDLTDPSITVVVFTSKEHDEVQISPTGQRLLCLGVGEKRAMNRRKFILFIRRIIVRAKEHKMKKVALDFFEVLKLVKGMSEREAAQTLAENFEMANYEFVKFKTPPSTGWDSVEEVMVVGKVSARVQESFQAGQCIGQEVNHCRTLTNTPGGDMTPAKLAEAAREAVKNRGVRVVVLGRKEMERLKMGAILGVAKGSSEEPKFIILEYRGGRKPRQNKKGTVVWRSKDAPVVLVGKGVTFDTGGLNLKPEEGMYEMHMDMSGGAAIIHAIAAAAKLKLRKNIVGLIPAVENMPSGASYRPGDVLVSMLGKTIEVLNTDAEGRVILADALTYAKRFQPRLVVDVATLTGAVITALGVRASGLFTSEERLQKISMDIAERSGDYLWPLPLWEEYESDIKGTFADVANVGKKARKGGAIMGAIFLYQFAKDYPWIHLDIASRMTAADDEYLSKGAAGAPVRFLVALLEQF